MTVRSRVAPPARRAGFGFGVVVAFLVIAFGSAGLVTSVDHLPGTSARPELTWAGDEAVRPGLDAAARDLEAMTNDIDRLGVLGRGALAALAGSRWDVLNSTIDQGAVLVVGIRAQTDALRGRLLALPGPARTAQIRLSQDSLDRQQRLFDALDATGGLATAWARLDAGSLDAARLSTLLTDHDRLITEAIDAGLKRRTPEALRARGLERGAVQERIGKRCLRSGKVEPGQPLVDEARRDASERDVLAGIVGPQRRADQADRRAGARGGFGRPGAHRGNPIPQRHPAPDMERRAPADLDVADAIGRLRLDELRHDPAECLGVLHQRNRQVERPQQLRLARATFRGDE